VTAYKGISIISGTGAAIYTAVVLARLLIILSYKFAATIVHSAEIEMAGQSFVKSSKDNLIDIHLFIVIVLCLQTRR
jgi:hypothetical protein